MNFDVCRIEKWETYDWLKHKHYARRIPSITYAFGLYNQNVLIGVCTFGKSGAINLNNLCGFDSNELNRLVVEDDLPKNSLSFFVSGCLKLLPQPMVVYSYADETHGHKGYIYQATNWIYTGLSSADTEYELNGKKFHRKGLFDRYGTGSTSFLEGKGYKAIKQKPKHRYVFFCGDKRQKKQMFENLQWEVLPYPKGNNDRYDSSTKIETQQRLFV